MTLPHLNVAVLSAPLLLQLLLLLFPQPLRSSAATLSFDYSSFAPAQDPNNRLVLQGSSARSTSGTRIWLTPNTRVSTTATNTVGRLHYSLPLTGGITTATTTFSTRFTFKIVTYPASYGNAGHGFAFFISPDASIIPGSSGRFLGLTSATSTRHFFAVEFDTFKNAYDPSASHIALDVNTVSSHTYVIDTSSSSQFNLYDEKVFRAWIRYDSASNHKVSVYLDDCTSAATCSNTAPATPILTAYYDLSTIFTQSQSVYFGFSASTGAGSEVEGVVIIDWRLNAENS